jgi:hypothetical protein
VTIRRLPDDLPARLKKAGLKVVEIDGWRDRGRPVSTGGFGPVGVLNHHTGSFDRVGDLADDLSYAKWLAKVGRSDLPAPLVQLTLSVEGTVYVLASGRSNHAGVAKASGSVAQGDGNSLYVGIEWMLSGTQQIPKTMYEAGATLNAVLLEILGSSVQAVSCHYQTSVTGKWDIGDPNGISFNGHKVLNVPKFRLAVTEARKHLHPETVKAPTTLLRLMHASLQFGIPDRDHTSDLTKIFDRAQKREVAWITGTEAGPGSGNTGEELIRIGKEHGYRLWVPATQAKRSGSSTDCWVAVRRDLVKGDWETGYEPGIPGSAQLYKEAGIDAEFPRWGPKGVAWVSFDSIPELGHVSVGAAHYLTDARSPKADPIHGVDHWEWNNRLANVVGEWAREKGAGAGLAFYGGDQNMADSKNDEPQGDTFFGSPLTSAWDEVDHYENTGHGDIDVIASYDKDGRVEAQAIRALDDKEFPLQMDHFAVEAEYRVRHLG